MAVSLGDARNGFRYSEIVRFINEEVLQNGGGPDFYSAFSARSWYEIEDQLGSIVMNPQVPDNLKRAFAWSALALGVRVAARQRDDYARSVWRLQEHIERHETTAKALVSKLQQRLKERDWLVWQCRRAREDLQWTLDQREAARRQLLLAEKLRQQVVPRPLAQQFRYDMQPLNVGEQSQVLAKMRQRRLGADSQRDMVSTTGVLYVSSPPGPSGPRMPTRVTHPPGRYPAVGSKKKALQCDEESQSQKEGPVRSHFINPSGHSRSRDRTSEMQQLQGQVPSLPKAPGTCVKLKKLWLPVCEPPRSNPSASQQAAVASVTPQLAGDKKNVKESGNRRYSVIHLRTKESR